MYAVSGMAGPMGEGSIRYWAVEDGPDRGFRNVGTTHSDAGEIPKRKYTKYTQVPHFTGK
jgi:hypothetical protein